MVSGFLTSPCDHSRIFSGDASEMRIALKESGSLGFSKKLKVSGIGFFLFVLLLRLTDEKLGPHPSLRVAVLKRRPGGPRLARHSSAACSARCAAVGWL